MKKLTRIDVFANIDEYIKFMDWAKTKEPKTRADMVRLLADYKKPDMVVDAHPEIVEHKISRALKIGRIKPSKENPNAPTH
jgi:hypothetical protein